MTNPFATFDPPLAGPPVLEPTDVSVRARGHRGRAAARRRAPRARS